MKFGDLKFLDAAHVKDLLALLRFAENPRDRVAGCRVLQLMPGIGPTSAQRVLEHIARSADPATALAARPAPPRVGMRGTTLSRWCKASAVGQGNWPAELERARLWCEPHLQRIHEVLRGAAPISSNFSRPPQAIRHASASSPSSFSIHW